MTDTDTSNTENTKTTPEVIKAWACHCGDDGEAEMKQLIAEVCSALECDISTMVTDIIYDLAMNTPSIYVKMIDAEQWGRIVASTPYPEDRIEFDVQCDMFEHGFAKLWTMVRDRFKTQDI